MLSTYLVCTTCESLFSPKLTVCPICGMAVDAGTGCRASRILPHVVCGNCGYFYTRLCWYLSHVQQVWSHSTISKIMEQPVKLKIIGIMQTKKYKYKKYNMENQNNTDEERKRRAFMNALSNMGLFEMLEEEKAETAPCQTSATGEV